MLDDVAEREKPGRVHLQSRSQLVDPRLYRYSTASEIAIVTVRVSRLHSAQYRSRRLRSLTDASGLDSQGLAYPPRPHHKSDPPESASLKEK